MLKAIFGIFSQYVHPFEKKADKFFRKIKSHHSSAKTHKKLENLMQENLIVLNLWMEKKYKNYVYLKKRVRRKMYEDVEILKEDFLRFAKGHKMDDKKVAAKFKTLGVSFPNQNPEHLKFFGSCYGVFASGQKVFVSGKCEFWETAQKSVRRKTGWRL